jgi:hypothetical protein
MIRFGMRVSRRAHVLEIALYQRRFVSRQRSRVAMRRRALARAQAERANRGADKKDGAPVTQSRWLLTVIHNPMQEYFFGDEFRRNTTGLIRD